MPPKPKKSPTGAGDARLLHDIETLSKALSIESKKLPPSRSASLGRSNPNPNSNPNTKKKSSFWSWKSLKALSHIRSRRIDCRFSLHVHSIRHLPPLLAGSSIVVNWKHTTDPSSASCTRAARVVNSSAEFDELLNYRCSVYGTRSGSTGSAKYEARHFLIWASVEDAPGIDLGRNLVDLTRLLPLTLEELEEEEKRSGKWSTSFKLSGKGKGAEISVSFGFTLAGFADAGSSRVIRTQSVETVKVPREVLPSSKSDSSKSVLSSDSRTYKSEEVKGVKSDLKKGVEEKELEEPEFMVTEKGIELSSDNSVVESKSEKAEFSVSEDLDTANSVKMDTMENLLAESGRAEFANGEVTDTAISERTGNQKKFEVESRRDEKEDTLGQAVVEKVDVGLEETFSDNHDIEDLVAEFDKLPGVDWENLQSPEAEYGTPRRMSYGEVKTSYRTGPRSKSLSLDDETVATEFLNMLGIEHSPFGLSSDSDPESPREKLWKQFAKESLNSNSNIFGLDMESSVEPDWSDANYAEDFDLSAILREAETELQMATQDIDSKSRAKLMEDAETEALMRQYGIDEKTFQGSPPPSKTSGFGSPIDLPPEEPLELPPLCEGLGPFAQTSDGGFLRSMSPSLFKNAKNNGHLVMQVSSPVVVPAEMGSGIMEILQKLASVGIEKLSMQAKKLMPLEDISGNTLQQMAWEAAPALEACDRQEWISEPMVDQVASRGSKRGRSPKRASSVNEMTSEYVSIEDLAPLAMDKIEALSIEGLRIQSGMSNEEAPSNISPQSIGEMSAFEGKGAMNNMSLGMEGTGGLQLMDVKDSGDELDGLMGLSITLDEWMRLDSGMVDEEDEISDRTSKILAAHHARATDMITGGSKRGGRRSGKRWGLLGNNFTVALMVQLRDPLRNYEPVGTPMLSLIQVERVFVPPKPKIYNTVSEKGNSEEPDEPEIITNLNTNDGKKDEEEVPQFKITEVHVAGLKAEPSKKKIWGNPMQQQSGSRWLLATGMGKNTKHPFMKSKAIPKPTAATTTVQPGETLWSISSRVLGSGTKWKELAALNPHIRNPNVVLPNQTIRLK